MMHRRLACVADAVVVEVRLVRVVDVRAVVLEIGDAVVSRSGGAGGGREEAAGAGAPRSRRGCARSCSCPGCGSSRSLCTGSTPAMAPDDVRLRRRGQRASPVSAAAGSLSGLRSAANT